MTAVRVLVADDQPAVRAGLVLILRSRPGIEVVAEAPDGAAAVEIGLRLRPDVVLMDLRMPRLDGVAATRELVAGGVRGILALTTFDLDEYLFGALRAGAAGFLLKDASADELVEAVRTVARGEGVVAPAVTRRVLAAFAGPGARAGTVPAPVPLGLLTGREREVLECLGAGLSNATIAARLGIAEATTKTHVSRILAKLGLQSRMQAAIAARQVRSLDT
ncbi:response regulator transcription factor [Dactylosporangium sp. NPDC000244]|uniref:response regulator transcription factor n=1 Tax=Dactylosporangium sp. NPDC000244 TaxID=3154365 RepID=UPI003329EADB